MQGSLLLRSGAHEPDTGESHIRFDESRGAGQDPHRQPAPLIKKRRAPVAQLVSAISCALWEGDVCAALLVVDVKTAAVLDLQKLSCPPH
jgi:hypothetical protein